MYFGLNYNSMTHRYLFFTVFIVTLWSCNPNDDTESDPAVTDEQFAQNFGAETLRDFMGQVVDLQNHPIAGAAVTIGNTTVQTDVNGVFIINNAAVYEKFAHVSATKAGFIDGSRSLVPSTAKNRITIMLIPATPIATIASGSEADVDLPNGTKVTFDGEFEDENGNAYSGNVNVSMFHLEPSNHDIDRLMPGMLYGKGTDGNPELLQTFGMLNVELRGSGGQKLNIAHGHTAQVSMKIDDTQLATAPVSMPLWHFDEGGGYWKQDGLATRQGGFYIGEVSHFSWWNCDIGLTPVHLTVNVFTETTNGNVPLANAQVTLIRQDGQSGGLVYTDSQGQASGLVPSGETMTLIVDDICGVGIYEAEIGPFTADAILPNIVLTGNIEPAVISGTLINCAGDYVSDGYAALTYGNQIYFSAVSDGSFEFNILSCGTTGNFTIAGIDYATNQSTMPINATLLANGTNEIALVACNIITEFAMYQIDDNPPQLFLQNVTKTGGTNADGTFHIATPSFTQGTWETGMGEHFWGPDLDASYDPNDPDQGIYTIVGSINPGEWRDFYFTGTFTAAGVQHNLKITIHSNH